MDGIATQSAQIVSPAAGGIAFGNASRDFDGSSYIDTVNFDSVFQGSFTISAWVKLTDGQPSTTNSVFANRDAASNNFFSLDCRPDGKLDLVYESAGSQTRITTAIAFSNGQTGWAHLVAIVNDDSSVATIYKDAVSFGSVALVGTMASFSSGLAPYIGGRNYNGSLELPFSGLIADVRIYSRAISPSEVADLASGTDISSANLEGWWLTNNNDVLDYSGNGNDGTNNGNGSTYSTDGPLD